MWIVIPLSSATPMPDNFLLAFNQRKPEQGEVEAELNSILNTIEKVRDGGWTITKGKSAVRGILAKPT